MRKRNILKSIAGSVQRKATNATTQGVYTMLWGEEPPKKKKRVKIK